MPNRARINPPTAGPMTSVALYITWFSARAAGSWLRGTRFGIAAERVGVFTPRIPACTPVTV